MLLCAGWLAIAAVGLAAGNESPGVPDEGSASLNAIVQRLQRHYHDTASFSAKFKEQVVSASGARRDREGTIEYRKPGRLRWDFAPPQSETIVSDGTTVYVYDPDLNQVIETPLARAFRNSAPAALLLGMGDLERDFVASLPAEPPKDDLLHLALKARADGTRVALGLDPKTCNVRALAVSDDLGNVTTITFSDIRTNIGLDDALFSFKVPAGADVVTPPGAPN